MPDAPLLIHCTNFAKVSNFVPILSDRNVPVSRGAGYLDVLFKPSQPTAIFAGLFPCSNQILPLRLGVFQQSSDALFLASVYLLRQGIQVFGRTDSGGRIGNVLQGFHPFGEKSRGDR